MLTASTVNGWPLRSRMIFSMATGSSRRQYGHQVAQKYTSTTLPRCSARETLPPDSAGRAKSAARPPDIAVSPSGARRPPMSSTASARPASSPSASAVAVSARAIT